MSAPATRSAVTGRVTVYIAGDPAMARHLCRQFCMRGLCVTVTPTEFIYTGGAEEGVAVGLVNYPRFPCRRVALVATATELGEFLMEGLCQQSFLVVSDTVTTWYSRRPEDIKQED